MIKREYREEIYLIALVLLGLYLSLIENIIPKPFPWMKIGLSNISVLIALEKFNSKMALQTILLRVFIQALMLGTLFTPNFIISFSAGLVSTLFMIFLYKFRKYLSLLSISCISAFTHNLLQLIVVYFLLFRNISLNSKSIIIFIVIFLGLGVIMGLITGVIATKINLKRKKMKRIFIAFLLLLMASMLNAAQFRDVKDISGNVVKAPVNVEKIATLWYANNQIVLMLGGADKIVATTDLIKNNK